MPAPYKHHFAYTAVTNPQEMNELRGPEGKRLHEYITTDELRLIYTIATHTGTPSHIRYEGLKSSPARKGTPVGYINVHYTIPGEEDAHVTFIFAAHDPPQRWHAPPETVRIASIRANTRRGLEDIATILGRGLPPETRITQP